MTDSNNGTGVLNESGQCAGDMERRHALGASNAFHHKCEETGEELFAVPDTNGRLRCCRCGAYQQTSGGETHVDRRPIAFSVRSVDTATDQEGDR